jgi:hypothetical protein
MLFKNQLVSGTDPVVFILQCCGSEIDFSSIATPKLRLWRSPIGAGYRAVGVDGKSQPAHYLQPPQFDDFRASNDE